MQWLHTIVDELIARVPEGEILIESGASPSGTYHVGHLREVITSDAILLELRRRGRQARHIHFVDDLDALRKVPVNVPQDYDQHLGKPLCDTPAPDGSDQSYADHFLSDLIAATSYLGIEMEVIRSHEKYRSGFDVPAIEMALTHIQKVKDCIVKGSGRQLSDDWNPIQILEEGRFKNRALVDIDKEKKEVIYRRVEGGEARARYEDRKSVV